MSALGKDWTHELRPHHYPLYPVGPDELELCCVILLHSQALLLDMDFG